MKHDLYYSLNACLTSLLDDITKLEELRNTFEVLSPEWQELGLAIARMKGTCNFIEKELLKYES